MKLLTFVERYWIGLTLGILTVITALSLWPLEKLPPVPGTDKSHHLVAYTLLMFPTALRKPKHWVLFGSLYLGYSGLIELLQPYVNRYGEWLDLAANAGGIVCGLILAQLIVYLYPNSSPP